MVIATRLELLDSLYREAATCLVCGNEIPAGEGVTATYRGRIVRFRCPDCLARFEAEPERFLAGHPGGCCQGQPGQSPASEWTCD